MEGVTAFVAEGLRENARAVVVARPMHWTAIAGALRDQGLTTDGVVSLDARTTLTLLMREGRIDAHRFDAIVRPMIAELAAASPARLRIYGEMVDILASDGQFAAVDALEGCWNALLPRVDARLLCGYASAHFAVGDRTQLLSVCHAHSHVRTGGDDSLGAWLVRTSS